jgi:plastocyanin
VPRLPVLRIVWIAALVAAAAFAGCKDSKNPASPGGGGTPADLTINILGVSGTNSYSGNPDTVTVGQTVAWHNSDGTTHTATADGGSFNTGNLGAGATSGKFTMNTAGSFAYHCTIHGATMMSGTLVVKP